MIRTVLASSLVAFALLLPIGCSSGADAGPSEDAIADAEDALSVGASALVADYVAAVHDPGGFVSLVLSANGKYTATIDISDVAFCVTAPCVRSEDGTWNAVKRANGSYRLRLRAKGEASRYFEAQKSAAGIALTRDGRTQALAIKGPGDCASNADCASGEVCTPSVCLMHCLVEEPGCCAAATCQPGAPPPPPSGTCCDPQLKPFGGVGPEGIWCCADGSWQYDVGSGDEALSCSASGGPGGKVCQ